MSNLEKIKQIAEQGLKEKLKMEIGDEICQNCRWWDWTIESKPQQGECHKHAPRLIVASCGIGEAPEYSPDWAKTYWNQWCGDFQKR